ncbi:MAG: preprotein translocase subunit SecG [Clostridia bacterium]|nr:preprotein translocase subunit SecG [Clostridia bacterium]
MFKLANLLALPTSGSASYNLYMGLSVTMIILMAVSALTAVVLVLLQPGNSRGIDALGGSSETFFGKNKGKSIEARMKKWTWICLLVLVIFSIAFYILQLETLWA